LISQSRGLGDVYKRQMRYNSFNVIFHSIELLKK
jgi:hypothetical protein